MLATEKTIEALLTEKEAARVLSISHRTLQAWRAKGIGPIFINMGRVIRYCRRDLGAWMNSNRHLC